MIRYLLDTNIARYVVKKHSPEILQTFNEHSGSMALGSITLAELFIAHRKALNLKNSKKSCTNRPSIY